MRPGPVWNGPGPTFSPAPAAGSSSERAPYLVLHEQAAQLYSEQPGPLAAGRSEIGVRTAPGSLTLPGKGAACLWMPSVKARVPLFMHHPLLVVAVNVLHTWFRANRQPNSTGTSQDRWLPGGRKSDCAPPREL